LKSKVIVTGCHGFIGKHLTNELICQGYNVIGIDNLSNSSSDPTFESKFTFLKVDLLELDITSSIFDDVEFIFHLAAKARVQPSFLEPESYYKNNVFGTLRVLELARVKNVKKVIFSSSSSVYGKLIGESSSEDDVLNPESPYAHSKVLAEMLCEQYAMAFGINFVVLRYFNVFGDDQPNSGSYPQMLPYFLKLYNEGSPFIIYGDGYQRRDFTHVSDVVDANLKSIELDVCNEVFNVGSGLSFSVNEICYLIDPDHKVQYKEKRNEPFKTKANNQKIWQKLRWEPKVLVNHWITSKVKT